MELFLCHKSLDYRTRQRLARVQNLTKQAVIDIVKFGRNLDFSVNSDQPWQNTNTMNTVIYIILFFIPFSRWQFLRHMARIDCPMKTVDALKQPWRTFAHRNRSPVAEVFLYSQRVLILNISRMWSTPHVAPTRCQRWMQHAHHVWTFHITHRTMQLWMQHPFAQTCQFIAKCDTSLKRRDALCLLLMNQSDFFLLQSHACWDWVRAKVFTIDKHKPSCRPSGPQSVPW